MKTSLIEESKLYFGNNIVALDPRIGLLKGGPVGPYLNADVDHRQINYGVVGTAESLEKCKTLVRELSNPLEPVDKSTYGNLGFPGLGKKSPLLFSLITDVSWEQLIFTEEITTLTKISRKEDQRVSLINLFENKIKLILEAESRPDIIFISIPREITDMYSRKYIKDIKIKFADKTDSVSISKAEGDIDFHNIIKVIGMKYKIPTQLFLIHTIESILDKIISDKERTEYPTEDPATFAWNVAVAVYYKAFGTPWKLTKLDDNVCYIGISFFRDFSEEKQSLQASIAQVFLSTGESFILRGEPFEWKSSKKDRNPRLSKEYALNLMNYVLDFYCSLKKTYPLRIVIHKSSHFNSEEIEGFYSNKANVKIVDMITLNNYSTIRFCRNGLYPVLRGTHIEPDSKEDKSFLYLTGFIPALGTYPGPRIPVPVEITRYSFDTPLNKIAEEIISLSRLDWNNIKFNSYMPVTLLLSRRVGKIMSEARSKEIEIDPHYRFYM